MAPASVPPLGGSLYWQGIPSASATRTSACTILCGTMKLPSATVIAGQNVAFFVCNQVSSFNFLDYSTCLSFNYGKELLYIRVLVSVGINNRIVIFCYRKVLRCLLPEFLFVPVVNP